MGQDQMSYSENAIFLFFFSTVGHGADKLSIFSNDHQGRVYQNFKYDPLPLCSGGWRWGWGL